jgi:hypothetical protein
MSKKHKQIDNEKQANLFALLEPDSPPSPGSMAIGMRLRHAASKAVDNYVKNNPGKGRIDLCAEIYKLTGIEVPKSTLDGWTAESRDLSNEGIDFNGNKRWGMPGEIIPAFCFVTGDWEILFIQAEAGNYKALKGKDVVRARIGLLKEEITKKNQELKGLEKALVESN